MESYRTSYPAVIVRSNQQRQGAGDDEDDPQNLPDDDLLLWANAQITIDNQTEKDLEDEMALKIAQTQQQQYRDQQVQQRQHQQQQQQQQQQHQQQLQYGRQQPQQQQLNQHMMQPFSQQLRQQHHQQQQQHHHQQQQQQQHQQQQQQQHQQQQQQQQQQSSHVSQYHAADVQQGLQQFDAIHGYLDANIEDPRTSLTLLERSRQRNPLPTAGMHQQLQHPHQQQQVHYESPSGHATYTHQSTAPVLRQPPLTHQQRQLHTYSAGASPLPSPTVMHDYHNVHAHSYPHSQHPFHQHADEGGVHSPISLSPRFQSPGRPAQSSALTSHEEKLQQLEHELEEYQSELTEERKLQQIQSSPGLSSAMDTDESGDKNMGDHEGPLAYNVGAGDGSVENDDSMHTDSGSNASRSRSNSLLSRDDPDYASKLVSGEDKRRRNTAASARFRQKKRLREQLLEKTAKAMTEKSELLEARVKELEMEIKWLRGLIVEKDTSRVLSEGKSSLSQLAFAPSVASTEGLLVGTLPSALGSVPTGAGSNLPPSLLLHSQLHGSGGSASSAGKTSSRRKRT
ncbi:hypothetical protein BGZ98_009360 [Dissophora globulifera]|nr:hypothetical protein BGZ98_009360 [Dissophora globulifera]